MHPIEELTLTVEIHSLEAGWYKPTKLKNEILLLWNQKQLKNVWMSNEELKLEILQDFKTFHLSFLKENLEKFCITFKSIMEKDHMNSSALSKADRCPSLFCFFLFLEIWLCCNFANVSANIYIEGFFFHISNSF